MASILDSLIDENRIEDSLEQGVYLYARADRNQLRNNQILRSGLNGIYIKSGGNRIEGNTIVDGNVGITIVGGEHRTDPPQALPALDPSGDQNIILGTTIKDNRDVGLRILGGSYNQVGSALVNDGGNRIEANGKDGIAIGDATSGTAATDNSIVLNTIHGNSRHGVLVTDQTSVRNRISLNSITGNGQLGIKIDRAAQSGIEPPAITTIAPTYLRGTAKANAQIEVYSDPGDSGQRLLQLVPATLQDAPTAAAIDHNAQPTQDERFLDAYSLTDYEGQTYLATVTANGEGIWSFPLPIGQAPELVSVLAIDDLGNTSAFSGSLKGTNNASYAIAPDDNNQVTIKVSGIGSTVTLPEIAANLGAGDAGLLQDLGQGVWLLNANLFLEIGVTLNLVGSDGLQSLRLRSAASSPPLGVNAGQAAAIDYSSFVYIRTYNGAINIDNVDIFSWDPQANDYDREPENGRAYLLAKYAAEMNIRDAEIGYLGSNDGESYGLTWRDVNDPTEPDVLRTRVTGEVINSLIHHNYYGIYTYQASDMLFRNNKFYANVRYGFDPHDFSHDFLVEGNAAYDNGAHGFILSRGCNNFVVRNNKSYNNLDPSPGSLAHGFMLDPGSPNSSEPQAASYANLLENNEAYGNEGYGLRILGSNTNEIRGNYFHDNEMGLTLEDGSSDNQLLGNTATANTNHGFQIRQNANNNTLLGNTATGNSANGFYVRASGNRVEDNHASANLQVGIAVRPENATALQNNTLISNTVSSNAGSGVDIRGATNTTVQQNRIEGNGLHGIYLTDGAVDTVIRNNIIALNNDTGIRVNASLSYQNRWSANAIYDNKTAGINLAGGANNNVARPKITTIDGRYVSGRVNAPGAAIEIFTDTKSQGRHLIGSGVADEQGNFTIYVTGSFIAPGAVVVATDSQGNSSEFSDTFIVENLNPDLLIFLPVIAK